MATFVIVGAGLAGASAAGTLRAEGFPGRIVLIGEEPERPYERPPLSKGYLLGRQERDTAFLHDADWYPANGIDLVLGVRAAGIVPSTRTLLLAGLDPVPYDKLLLATGSRVRMPLLPGFDAHGVHHLRTIAQADTLLAALRGQPNVLILGAGWIGLETAAAARAYGCRVTLVETDEWPLRRLLGDELGRFFADLHRAHGVDLRLETTVREFGSIGDLLTDAVLDDNTEVAADLAIVGIGVAPATELAEAAGLQVDNGVVTDENLRTSHPDIWACGDVASAYHPLLGRHIRVEHWANAIHQGRAAARSMLGQQVVYDRVPYFFSDQYDISLEYSGHVDPHRLADPAVPLPSLLD